MEWPATKKTSVEVNAAPLNIPWREQNDAPKKPHIILIPTPSDDERDPLNWSPRRKYLYLAILCISTFAAAGAPCAHLASYFSIAETYDRTPNELSYTISAASAGLLGGPFLLAPLAKVVGRTSLIFWSLLGVIATQIWAATATSSGDYISFVMSRTVSGVFGSIPTVMGAGYIMDMFFLHQRGFGFLSYELALLLGVNATPTIGGFIVQNHPWPQVFYWTLGPLGLAVILVVLFLPDTEFALQTPLPSPTSTYLSRRTHLLLGHKTTPQITLRALSKTYLAPFLIAATPVTFLTGLYTLIYFGWCIFIATELAIFLQLPPSLGGYGFSATQTAAFTCVNWAASLFAQFFGAYYNDRMPLWIAFRRKGAEKGVWRPEDRLWSLLIGPSILGPVGLAITGVTLHFHLHYMVLALGYFLVMFAAQICVPVSVNYIVENFTGKAVEVSVAMTAYRLALGIAIGFFFADWQEAVGVGWLFGTTAMISVFAMGVLSVVALYGRELRGVRLFRSLVQTEDGQKLSVEE